MITFGRDKTKILKGIALLMMLVHHTSMPSYWADEGTTWFSFFSLQESATKLCVWIFAFLVGYGFFYSGNKTIRYSVKRILMLIVPFWAMMVFMFIPLSSFYGGFFNEMKTSDLDGAFSGGGNYLQFIWYF